MTRRRSPDVEVVPDVVQAAEQEPKVLADSVRV